MEKWNPKTRTHTPYEIPENWHTPLYTDNMEEVVNCAQCGKLVTFGQCYTSRQIQSKLGFGYPVCGECYEKEWKEEQMAYGYE